ncbi:hypothetical protein HanXRQr2_Chr16g0731351 [Helianthus annuus]|uniref:Uncharacterized protein n=1 Tax=Helianthus annuus TaxID=4232 RepID=A0A9K3DQS7_HELAN|nr:hypothetical protein HanXRQr2_Chr16g0731351 [Helianthus annuus]KAJ0436940.1 hypothetical protein HanHA300_Chr16g0596251 [Helianthus annuus]KAJ0459252.1 hypothetical protein HanHA89_Chr16g0646741 [Helianthus annuus]
MVSTAKNCPSRRWWGRPAAAVAVVVLLFKFWLRVSVQDAGSSQECKLASDSVSVQIWFGFRGTVGPGQLSSINEIKHETW